MRAGLHDIALRAESEISSPHILAVASPDQHAICDSLISNHEAVYIVVITGVDLPWGGGSTLAVRRRDPIWRRERHVLRFGQNGLSWLDAISGVFLVRGALREKWAWPALGALFGSVLWPSSTFLLSLIDARAWRPPNTVELSLSMVWFITSLPGAIVDGQGLLTLTVVTACWAAAGGGLAYFLQSAIRRRGTLK